ncbi:hypothetical protein DL95DRAFT_408618 [Leptodontidium sp. 2 PMI_412]|nr:hypothetical protein DL95DRAFT_408618 [Leptodontidium sp. 2 PMI_412]
MVPNQRKKPKLDYSDCRVCNRRRIKCDRSTPCCKKCTSRNFASPGYGVILNWEWGVASRGKLAGKTVPSVRPASASEDTGLASISSFAGDVLQETTARRLFHHYGQTIAASMVWVDAPENQWRTTMMSMALQSTPLLLSILAFAAEHLSSATLSSCAAPKKDLTMRAKN